MPAAAGSCTLSLPAGAGALYELRLLSAPSSVLLATSGTIGVPALAGAPAMVAAGASATVSWSDLSSPAPSDWVGLYAPDGSQAGGFYLDSCAAASSGAVPAPSGSCSYALPDAGGAYVLRLYSSVASGLLASSRAITVTSPVLTTPPVIPPPVVPPAPVVPSPVKAVATASPAAPVDASAPLISGAARAGHTLACAPGSWSGAPTAFAYSWLRDGAALAGASARDPSRHRGGRGTRARVRRDRDQRRGRFRAGSPARPSRSLAFPPAARVLGVAVNRRARSVTVRFDVTGDATAVRCALVRAGSPRYAPCTSPRTYAGVRPGRYALYVVARGPGGAQATPTVYRFTVAAPPRR